MTEAGDVIISVTIITPSAAAVRCSALLNEAASRRKERVGFRTRPDCCATFGMFRRQLIQVFRYLFSAGPVRQLIPSHPAECGRATGSSARPAFARGTGIQDQCCGWLLKALETVLW